MQGTTVHILADGHDGVTKRLAHRCQRNHSLATIRLILNAMNEAFGFKLCNNSNNRGAAHPRPADDLSLSQPVLIPKNPENREHSKSNTMRCNQITEVTVIGATRLPDQKPYRVFA